MENVNENDKLIAEFMGKETRTRSTYWEGNILRRHDFDEPQFYSTSWDWLMPVWKKCTEIGLWMMTNGYDKLWLEKEKEIETAMIREFDCEKSATLISQLIKWYNQNK